MERHEIMYTRQQSTRTSNYKSDDNYNCVQRKFQTIRQQVNKVVCDSEIPSAIRGG